MEASVGRNSKHCSDLVNPLGESPDVCLLFVIYILATSEAALDCLLLREHNHGNVIVLSLISHTVTLS